MRKTLLLAAIAAATALPTSANAQARGGIIIVPKGATIPPGMIV